MHQEKGEIWALKIGGHLQNGIAYKDPSIKVWTKAHLTAYWAWKLELPNQIGMFFFKESTIRLLRILISAKLC